LFGRAPGPESDNEPPLKVNADTTFLYAAVDGEVDGTHVGIVVGEDGSADGDIDGEEEG